MNKKLLFLAGLAPLVAAPALVVASCSSSTTTDGSTSATPEQNKQAEDALKSAKFYLESKASIYIGKKPSELEFDVNFAPALQPSRNFGFRTQVIANKTEGNDDAKGTKEVTIKVSKTVLDGKDDQGKDKTKVISKEEKVTLTGLLTEAQAEAEKTNEKTKIADYINLDKIIVSGGTSKDTQPQPQSSTLRKATIYVKDARDEKKAPEYTPENVKELIDALNNPAEPKNTEAIKKYLDVAISSNQIDGFGYTSLLKKDGQFGVDNFKWTNVRETKNGNILSPTISADLQLVDGDKESGIVKVEIVGFKLAKGYENKVKPLIESMVQDFGTLYNPIVNDEKIKTLTPQEVSDNASKYLKSGDDGILLPEWNNVGGDIVMPLTMSAEIVENKVKSFNNADGSITLELKLKRVGGTVETGEFTKELTIFGFKISQ